MLPAVFVHASDSRIRPRDTRLLMPILFDGLVLHRVQPLLVAAAHDGEPPLASDARARNAAVIHLDELVLGVPVALAEASALGVGRAVVRGLDLVHAACEVEVVFLPHAATAAAMAATASTLGARRALTFDISSSVGHLLTTSLLGRF